MISFLDRTNGAASRLWQHYLTLLGIHINMPVSVFEPFGAVCTSAASAKASESDSPDTTIFCSCTQSEHTTQFAFG